MGRTRHSVAGKDNYLKRGQKRGQLQTGLVEEGSGTDPETEHAFEPEEPGKEWYHPQYHPMLADLPDRSIPTYDYLSYEEFLVSPLAHRRMHTLIVKNHHLIPNRPFVLAASVTSDWPSRQLWARQSANGSASVSRPNLAALRTYGGQVVPVADTARREFSEFRRLERPLSEVLDLWEQGDGEGLYVKDWHLLAEVEEQGRHAGEIYEVVECFRGTFSP
jgi:hypothetical protein